MQIENFHSLQLQYSIGQQRLEQMVQKYGLQHPKVLLQWQKVRKILIQMQQIIENYNKHIITE